MERKKLLKWIDAADFIFKNNSKLAQCPIDDNHLLTVKLEPFQKHNKLELILECKECGIKRTFTKEID